MASRKHEHDHARAERQADADAAAARLRRVQIFAGVAVIAVIVIGAAVAISTSGGDSANRNASDVARGQTHNSAIAAIDRTVDAELSGIPEHGTVLGDPGAQVTLEYFGDLQCPICADFTTGTGTGVPGSTAGGLPQFIANQVRRGEVKVAYKSMCSATCSTSNPPPGGGSDAFTRQQTAAYAAGAQERFWYFAETFYREQGSEDSGYVTSAFITNVAKQIPGLNLAAWAAARRGQAYATCVKQLIADDRLAVTVHARSTPWLIMVGPKKTVLVNDGNFAGYNDLVSAYKEVS